MVLQKAKFPQPGEIVICKITAIHNGYVQCILEDYKGLETEDHAQGMVHVTELSNRWVKNINSIVSIDQRLVLSVLKVNEERGYLDLSLRRVAKNQRTSKMNEWRYENKIESTMKFFSEQHSITIVDLYNKIIWPLVDKYGDLRTAFEEVKEAGVEELEKIPELTYDKAFKDSFFTLIQENVAISTIELVVEYHIQSMEGNGVALIKDAVNSSLKIRRPKGVDVKFVYIGAPVYRCYVEAKDYPTAEKHLQKITDKVKSVIEPHGTVEILRDHLSDHQKTTD